MAWPAPRLDLAAVGALTFQAPDPRRFPALAVAREALDHGRGAPAALNAANETAVAAFLDRKIGFLDIVAAVAETLERLDGDGGLFAGGDGDALEIAMTIDRSARRTAADVLSGMASAH
jgi:1-deoxy-D-xylulose-5-phosphate reductoisomerase